MLKTLWDMQVLSSVVFRTRKCSNLYDMQHQRKVKWRQGIGYRTLKTRVVKGPCPMGTLLAPTGPMLQQSLGTIRGACATGCEAHSKEQIAGRWGLDMHRTLGGGHGKLCSERDVLETLHA